VNVWLNQHLLALRDATRRLLAAPLSTVLALFVIGVALALPAAGWLLIDNLQRAAGAAAGTQQISVFMALDADRKAIDEIESRLKLVAGGHWRFVPRDEALKKLQTGGRMADLIAGLPKNPLPDAFVVAPADTSPAAMEKLAKDFAGWPKVAHVQLDSAWIKRFDAFLRIGKLAVGLLAAVFAFALIVVTVNTIRLQILAHAAEIELARLIGATEGWLRRPFAWFGALQGVLGGLFAALLLAGGQMLLAGPVADLAALYGAAFSLQGPSAQLTGALVAGGGLLGWLGALISVALHRR